MVCSGHHSSIISGRVVEMVYTVALQATAPRGITGSNPVSPTEIFRALATGLAITELAPKAKELALP